MKIIFIVMLLYFTCAQAATLSGTVKDDCGCLLPAASVQIENTTLGAVTDSSGRFEIRNLEPGSYSLRVSMVGFKSLQQAIKIGDAPTDPMLIVLQEEPIQMDEVRIDAEQTQSGIADDRVLRTEVIQGSDLAAHSTTGNLMTALEGETGLKTRPCAMCGSCGIGMQGMEASYTEVKVDGLSIYSGLGTLYGLDGISTGDVSRLEMVKGAGSSLDGAGAIAGSVNLISVEPTRSNSFEARTSSDQYGQSSLYVAGSRVSQNIPMRLSMNLSTEPTRIDKDGDGITDRPEYKRSNIQYSVDVPARRGVITLNGRAYWENRFAGDLDWSTGDRGSEVLYGREVLTRRQEASVQWQEPPGERWRWSANGAIVNHEQNSWYGSQQFDARQRLGIASLETVRSWNVRHSTTLEAGVHIEDYDDNLELNVPTDLQLTTPAFVAEHSWHPQVNWAILLGNRTEYYSQTDETVLTPRMALAWDATPMATFRLTAGTGYRPVTLFSLDASTMAGFENMILDDKLKPERSIALSLAANRRWTTQSHTIRIDVNVFYTDFSSKAIAKLGDGNSVLYANVNDAFSRGFELQAQWTDMNGWKGAAGFSRTQSRFLLHGDWMNTELQYSYTADGTLAKEWKQTGITTDVTGTVFGPQYLPEGRGRDKSPAYVIWNSSVRKQWDRFSATLGVNNIFDWTQSDNPYYFDPNTGRVNPDTALFYGPILGRTCLLSLGYTFGS